MSAFPVLSLEHFGSPIQYSVCRMKEPHTLGISYAYALLRETARF